MKKLLFLIIVSFMLLGCVAVPVYDSGYYPDYGPYPYGGPYYYGYAGPEVSVFVPVFHGGRGFHGGHGFHGGGGFRGGFHGGGSFRGGRR
jgi:hypothetical protein